MHERTSYFQCEAVTAASPEFIMDADLGELQISGALTKPEPPKTEPAIIDDPELGPLVLGPAPAMTALPRRTGPPRSRSAKTSGGR